MLDNEKIKELYLSGLSCPEIAKIDGRTARTLNRVVKRMGITRSNSEAFNNAIRLGVMKYTRKPAEQLKQRKSIQHALRYKILNKYGFRCCKCGNTAINARIQIDHIDNNPNNNEENNLQVLCEPCNKGKAYNL